MAACKMGEGQSHVTLQNQRATERFVPKKFQKIDLAEGAGRRCAVAATVSDGRACRLKHLNGFFEICATLSPLCVDSMNVKKETPP